MPLVAKWANKLLSIQTMKCYMTLKRDELSRQEDTWKKLKCLLLSKEASLKSLHTVSFQLCDILDKAKLWRQETDQPLPGARRRMDRQSTEDL